MASIALATYTISVAKSGTGVAEKFGGLDEGDFLRFCQRAFKSLQAKHHREDQTKHVFKVHKIVEDGRRIYGTVVAGEYGYSAEGISSEDFRRTYRRTEEDAEIIPFYFYLELPTNSSVGVLICQRHGTRGFYTSLRVALLDELRRSLPGYVLSFGRLVPKELVEEFMNGDLVQIKMTSYGVPSDIADHFKLGANARREAEYSISIRAGRGKFLPSIPMVEQWRAKRVTAYELPDGFDPGATKLQFSFSIEGRRRTFNAQDLSSILPYSDVSSDVQMLSNGHPEFESLHKVALSHAKDARESLGAG